MEIMFRSEIEIPGLSKTKKRKVLCLFFVQPSNEGITAWSGKIFHKFIRLPPSMCTGEGFPGGSVVKSPPANAGDMGRIPGLE